jgi:hypothetical protein
MQNRQIFLRAIIYSFLIIALGFLPSWIKLVNASFDFSKAFDFKEMMLDGSVLIVCLTLTTAICLEYIFFKMGKYILLRELWIVLFLPFFIILWGLVIIFLVLNISDDNLNLQKISAFTYIVCAATLIYVFQMVFKNNRIT